MEFKKEQLVKLAQGFTRKEAIGTCLEGIRPKRQRITKPIVEERYDISAIASIEDKKALAIKEAKKAEYNRLRYWRATPEGITEISEESYTLMKSMPMPKTWFLLLCSRADLLDCVDAYCKYWNVSTNINNIKIKH